MDGQARLAALFEQLVADHQTREFPKATPRAVQLPALPGKADVVVGMRRSGKTWLLYDRLAKLEAEGVRRSRTFYLNFEDERLQPLTLDSLTLAIEAFYRNDPRARREKCWLFFDEIQNVDGWERFVRRLLDSERVQIVVTGSSARLLGREVATSMRGRSLSTELLPFGFDEALAHASIPVPKRMPPPAAERSELERAFVNYLDVGGFPEVQALESSVRTRVLQEYIDVALFRDVVERHRVQNTVALRHLVRRLLRSPAAMFTVNKLYNDLKSLGVATSKDALHEYLAYVQDAYLAFLVPIDDESERRRAVAAKKVYLVDHGLARAVTLFRQEDRGHHLENVVYLALRRSGGEIAYHVTPEGFEVDFVVRRHGEPSALVQVCATLGDAKTRERELRALASAMEHLGLRESTIVTLGEPESLKTASGHVRVVPAWRWLLETK